MKVKVIKIYNNGTNYFKSNVMFQAQSLIDNFSIVRGNFTTMWVFCNMVLFHDFEIKSFFIDELHLVETVLY